MTTGAFGIHDKVVVMYVRLACIHVWLHHNKAIYVIASEQLIVI